MMATVDVLAAYLDCLDTNGQVTSGAQFEVICEHHEDWSLSNGDDAEIVSAKHKETQFGAFTTLRMLLDDGGVLHLFDRWTALKFLPSCRLVTTAGLNGDCRGILNASTYFQDHDNGSRDETEWDKLLLTLAKAIDDSRAARQKSKDDFYMPPPTETKETLIAFLKILRIDDGRPRRDHLRLMAANAYARPVAERLGNPHVAEAIWNAVLQVVRERMRAAGPTPRGSLPAVLGARNESGYESRTVSLDEVAVVIEVAVKNPSGYKPLPRRVRTSKVAIKMVEGGCSDNAVERAEALRRQYRRHWRDQTSGPTATASQQLLLNVLRRVIDQATDTVSRPDGPWGVALWRELQERLEVVAQTDNGQGLDTDLLLGGVSELSNRCEAWFSERFDAEERARQLAEEVIR